MDYADGFPAADLLKSMYNDSDTRYLAYRVQNSLKGKSEWEPSSTPMALKSKPFAYRGAGLKNNWQRSQGSVRTIQRAETAELRGL